MVVSLSEKTETFEMINGMIETDVELMDVWNTVLPRCVIESPVPRELRLRVFPRRRLFDLLGIMGLDQWYLGLP